jgi:hypothetical protein
MGLEVEERAEGRRVDTVSAPTVVVTSPPPPHSPAPGSPCAGSS